MSKDPELYFHRTIDPPITFRNGETKTIDFNPTLRLNRTNTLKVDIDLDFANAQAVKTWLTMRAEWLGVELLAIRLKPSEHHRIHAWVILDESLPLGLAMFYQLLLGDDPRRYKYNEIRLTAKHAAKFNILFSQKLRGNSSKSEHPRG